MRKRANSTCISWSCLFRALPAEVSIIHFGQTVELLQPPWLVVAELLSIKCWRDPRFPCPCVPSMSRWGPGAAPALQWPALCCKQSCCDTGPGCLVKKPQTKIQAKQKKKRMLKPFTWLRADDVLINLWFIGSWAGEYWQFGIIFLFRVVRVCVFYCISFPVLAALERGDLKPRVCSLMVPQQLHWRVRTAPGKLCEHRYLAGAEQDAPEAVVPMLAAAGEQHSAQLSPLYSQ